MKRKVKDCSECFINPEGCGRNFDKCESKNNMFVFEKDGQIAILDRNGVIAGYIPLITGDEADHYIQKMRIEGDTAEWSYHIIEKIDY